ncbi:DUF4245 domain-containing protein [Rhodococcus sp. NPDC058505]|uniref:DUF4245 domain-containing protein n=1 Tax=unclassified Rhodococcus (in: high G+C Gram-positive bacteria) TaxID=192944 RepID=UPI0036587FB5
MAGKKPRYLQDNRDIIWSLIPLALFAIVIAAVAQSCSFSPGGPTAGPVPQFDIDTALTFDAAELGFPVRNPAVPDSWQPNSGSRGTVSGDAGGDVSTVGYITDAGRYVQLSQSNAAEQALVEWVAGAPRAAAGAETFAGTSWVQFAEEGSEPIWVADLADARVLITGSGTAEEFGDLATAVGQAQPIDP